MQRIGDDQAGFSYELDPAALAIRVKAWGFWSVEVAASFGRKLADACREASKGSTLEMEMTDLKPMRDEGQLAFGALVMALPGLGITSASVRTGPLTKLQLMRIVTAQGAKDYVRFI